MSDEEVERMERLFLYGDPASDCKPRGVLVIDEAPQHVDAWQGERIREALKGINFVIVSGGSSTPRIESRFAPMIPEPMKQLRPRWWVEANEQHARKRKRKK